MRTRRGGVYPRRTGPPKLRRQDALVTARIAKKGRPLARKYMMDVNDLYMVSSSYCPSEGRWTEFMGMRSYSIIPGDRLPELVYV